MLPDEGLLVVNVFKKTLKAYREKKRLLIIAIAIGALLGAGIDAYNYWAQNKSYEERIGKWKHEANNREKEWARAQEADTLSHYRNFVARYHNGKQVELAKEKLRQLAETRGKPIFVFHKPNGIGDIIYDDDEFRSGIRLEIIASEQSTYKLEVKYTHPRSDLFAIHPARQLVSENEAFWGFFAYPHNAGYQEISATLLDYSNDENFPVVVDTGRVWLDVKPTVFWVP